MSAFKKVTGERARWLDLHERLRAQLHTALIERQRGAAQVMIARETLAALKPEGPRAVPLQVRFLRLQADGLERGQQSTARIAFLLRQLRRSEERLHEQD